MLRKSREVNSIYAAAGVNIDVANATKEIIKGQVQSTLRPEVLSELGLFCGLFELKGYQQPVIVASTDGVGTKLKVASAMGRYDTVGIDLVNHCVNDILTCGAEPLFFLDYIAVDKLISQQVEDIVKGLASACREVGCSLIGGEMAEMPGLYTPGSYDLAGFIIGCVEKQAIIKTGSIKVGDVVLGLPSSGVHTNGYSLVRKVWGTERSALDTFYPELGRTLGEELLEPHRCYYTQLKPVLPLITGIAHITGGGLIGNIPRVLPEDVSIRLKKDAWTVPPIFTLIQHQGRVEEEEMYRVFNMGIGMVIICSRDNVAEVSNMVAEVKFIGEVVKRVGGEQVVIE